MNNTTRPILTEITGPHFTNTADYDVVSQMMFPDVECFTSMLADPFYKENVMPDDANFADMSRTKYGKPVPREMREAVPGLTIPTGCPSAGSKML
jgi:EthD domain